MERIEKEELKKTVNFAINYNLDNVDADWDWKMIENAIVDAVYTRFGVPKAREGFVEVPSVEKLADLIISFGGMCTANPKKDSYELATAIVAKLTKG